MKKHNLDIISKLSLPWVDTAQMVEVDRAMIEDYQIGLIQMMENAFVRLTRHNTSTLAHKKTLRY